LYQLSKDDYPAEGVLVKGYIPETTDVKQLCAEMADYLLELASYGMDTGSGATDAVEVFEEDWAHAWKKYYKAVQVSPRLLVKPTWEELYATVDGMQVIEMDPGMAFGTGTHPTTLLCMQTLDRYLASEGEGSRLQRLIDVGTGTAILAIAAVKLGAREVLAIDLDPVAVESALRNVELNGVAAQVDVREGDLLMTIKQNEEWHAQADMVVANILADVIVLFVDDVWQALRPGGLYLTSGIITAKAPMVRAALEQVGFEIIEQLEDSDWVAIVARKVAS
jgi:ribosomal protein L11 methyltransferase